MRLHPLLFLALAGCWPFLPGKFDDYVDDSEPIDTDVADADTDADADADADTDTDADADTDADTDTDTDADADTDADPPTALIDAPDARFRYEDLVFDGTGSTDPLGQDLTYEWSLSSAPSGSAAVIDDPGDGTALVTPDAVGDYEVRLIVEAEDGRRSAPARTTAAAYIDEGLWVEIAWSVAGDDLDIHLLDADGVLDGTDDCYYATLTVDWGRTGSATDDPTLLADDIAGTGPEIIAIPQPANGTYHVWVNDYEGSVQNGANATTVTVYVNGAVAFTDTVDISGEATDTELAVIDWSGGSGVVSAP